MLTWFDSILMLRSSTSSICCPSPTKNRPTVGTENTLSFKPKKNSFTRLMAFVGERRGATETPQIPLGGAGPPGLIRGLWSLLPKYPPLALKPFRGTAWSHLPAIDFYSSQKQNLWLATQNLVSHARSTCSELRAIRLLFDRIGRFSGSKDISQQRSEIRPLRPKSLLVIKPIEWDTWIYHDLVQICFGWIDLSCLSLGAIWVGNFVRMDWINRCALFESLKPLNAPKGSKTVWNSELKTSEFISWSSLHL